MAAAGGQSTDNERVAPPEVPTTVTALEAITGVITPPSVSSLKATIRNSAKQFQERQYLWPPEMREYPCDIHGRWVDKLLDDNEPEIALLIKSGTENDFKMLIEDVFTEDIWTANRRAFFAALHVRARQCDETGISVSPSLARFYRDRYHPPYRFASER